MKKQIDGSKCKPLSLEEAKNLKYGNTVYFRKENDSRGALKKVKVNGQVKTWKRNTERVQIPWKYGLYDYGYITELYLDDWTLESKPYERFENVRVCPATSSEEMLLEYTNDWLQQHPELDDEVLSDTIAEIDELLADKEDVGYELYEQLPSLMNNYAPQGYYYGTHEADGEWGFWPQDTIE